MHCSQDGSYLLENYAYCIMKLDEGREGEMPVAATV